MGPQRRRFAILVADDGLDGKFPGVAVKGVDFLDVFFIDESAADFFGTRQFLIIRIQFFVQQEELIDSGLFGQGAVDPDNFALNQIVNLQAYLPDPNRWCS